MRLLLIVPHLSTGGLPQVALKRAELLKDDFELYVMEYRQLAWKYVVQRDKMIELLGDNFISLGRHETEEKRDKFEYYFNSVKPDVVHMEEIPEMFMRQEHSDYIYRKDRNYKIFETTHTSTFNIDDKKYFPDKFIFVSDYSNKLYSKFNIPIEIIEYPIDRIPKERNKYIEELELESDCFHVLNVGLFNRDKNQGYIFDIAKKLEKYNIKFHFVGNMAQNFEDYWKPLIDNKPENCIIWNERNDVEKFYHACDLLLFPSKLELNPLVIKEALSYQMPIFMNKLDVLGDVYDNDYLVKYLTNDIDKDTNLLLSNFNIRKNYTDSNKFRNSLIDVYNEKEIENKEIEYDITFLEGAKVEIRGNVSEDFDVEFINQNTNLVEYKTTIGTNSWAKTNDIYYKNWRVLIKKDEKILVDHKMNLEGKNVYIQFDTKSLGDNLAYVPYVEEFRKKHNCTVFCSTFWNNLFEKEYPDIIFINPGEMPGVKAVERGLNKEIYAKYNLGWYQDWKTTHNPNDYKKIPLQQTASDILGLEFKEIVPKITFPKGERPIEDKYVTIAQYSTANAKHWHYPYKNSQLGWQMLVDWLNAQGYKVMVISKQPSKLKNVIDRTGNFPIEHRLNEIYHSEFFIGIGSGLSWLAWALKKKVIMISGFSDPICEFKSDNIRIVNKNVCFGCFNRYEFDKGDWDWCPDHKNTERHFECTITIKPEMVIERIKDERLVEEIKKVSFDSYFVKARDMNMEEDKISINYEGETNKLIFYYGGDLPEVNIDIIDDDTNKVIQTLSDVVFKEEHSIWAQPTTKLLNRNISIRFYKEETIIKIKVNTDGTPL